MKAIYLDPFAGISGNMFIGALLEAGFPIEVLREKMKTVIPDGYGFLDRYVNKNGIRARFFDVELEGSCEHGRHLSEIFALIDAADLSGRVREQAKKVFAELAKAEALIHGVALESVHFHEVGAVDAIIDIVGACLGMEYLGIEAAYCGTITTGFGSVRCAHGIMPVPAPATAVLLTGLRQARGIVEREMTTPTGAAIVRTLFRQSVDMPEGFVAQTVVHGAGTRDVQVPNVLRMYVGTIDQETLDENLVEAASNVDDTTGETLAFAIERLMQQGALDAWAEPIVMKKGRPAYKICFLCRKDDYEALAGTLFDAVPTFGIRRHALTRETLDREVRQVLVGGEPVRVKLGFYRGKRISATAEFEDAKAVSLKTGLTLREVMHLAVQNAKGDL